MEKTIVSVFFKDCDAVRPYAPMDGSYGFCYPFHIDKAPPDGFKTLVVKDMMEHVYVSNGVYTEIPIYADDRKGAQSGVASDLVNEWAANLLGPGGDVGPGIFVCAGSSPTEAELAHARARQTRWCTWLVDLAQQKWLVGDRVNITSLEREAALWLGRNDLEWVKPPERVVLMACPYCTKSVNSMAAVCPNCHNVIDTVRFQQLQVIRQKLEQQGPVPSPDMEVEVMTTSAEVMATSAPVPAMGLGDPEVAPPARPLMPPTNQRATAATVA